MLNASPCTILLDVDNTLLDNDRFAAELTQHLDRTLGVAECKRYWSIYARLREERNYADYLGALQEMRCDFTVGHGLLGVSGFLLDYPFAERVYAGALDAITHLRRVADVAIFSDGDIVFQPHKIKCSGLWSAVAGRVMISIHKERQLDAMQREFPAPHYVMIDDKPKILAAIKRAMGERVTTLFVRQGHYAMESANETIDPMPDRTLENIGDVCRLNLHDMVDATTPAI